MITKICVQCGEVFEAESYKNRKYCSRECFYNSRIGKSRPEIRIEQDIKTCPVCGNDFLVGGRDYPNRKQTFCSINCQRLARYRSGSEANILSDTEAAYIAGFVDGEGSIMLTSRRDKASVKLSITNTDRRGIDWVATVTGIGNVNQQYERTNKRKATWFFHCNSDAAISIIKQILPYLKMKSAQAQLAIETQERLKDPALNANRTWQQEYITRMKKLNKRGPNL